MQGLFLCNKPSGPSSAQFLGQIKRILKIPRSVRVGHGGTLDPFAEGLLIIGISRAYTKLLHQQLKNETKEYEAEIVLGASSDTDDKTGTIQNINTKTIQQLASIVEWKKKIKDAIEELKQKTEQIPPRFSAVKLHGTPAYALARKGEIPLLQPKKSIIHKYFIQEIKQENGLVVVRITMTVSAGFYIRGFARDLGELIGVGGYVQALKRLKIGHFSLKNALNLNDFDQVMNLCVYAENPSKNEDLIGIMSAPYKQKDGLLVYTNTLSELQKILMVMNEYAKKNNIQKTDYFCSVIA
jgi:tRNA pseudouridine55 synthase